jgi:signal transduction histidine kinase
VADWLQELLKKLNEPGASGNGALGLRLDFRSQPGLWEAEFDEAACGRAIEEILRNAVESMAEGGKLTVRAQNRRLGEEQGRLQPGAYVEISIRDEGKGMHPVELENAFNLFFSTKASSQHQGLGLSIAYGIVRREGGDIFIQSSPQEGTEVRILVPAVNA